MMQVKENPEETKQLATLKEEHDNTKAAYEKNKSDDKVKKEYVDATVAYATATMLAESLPAKQKYPDALRLYREALEVDPKNETAIDNKKMIEDIYNSMGRPIPE
jgi:tetratricopeptide (TPR) repeat protein